MRTTIAPVDEEDTEFVIHPPRPLFPNVDEIPKEQVVDGLFYELEDGSGNYAVEDDSGVYETENSP